MENLRGSSFGDTLIGNRKNNEIFGRTGMDTIEGPPDDDSLSGGPGSDSLIGGSGIDSFVGAGGNDMISGGGGSFDAASYAGASNPVDADLQLGTAQGQGSDSLSGLEVLVGSGFADRLAGDGEDNFLLGVPVATCYWAEAGAISCSASRGRTTCVGEMARTRSMAGPEPIPAATVNIDRAARDSSMDPEMVPEIVIAPDDEAVAPQPGAAAAAEAACGVLEARLGEAGFGISRAPTRLDAAHSPAPWWPPRSSFPPTSRRSRVSGTPSSARGSSANASLPRSRT